MSDERVGYGRLVTVFGGSGFVGRHVVRALAHDGWRVRVACRRPDLAFYLQPLGGTGQIHAVQANIRHPSSVAAALRGAEAAVNLVGILAQGGAQRFDAVQTEGARTVAQAVHEAGIGSFVHMSALGADPHAASAATRTKAEGEAEAFAAMPGAVVLRPSIIFGPEDDFFNRFAAMARYFPVLPVVGADTKFQPVYVGDVACVIARALAGKVKGGLVYELGGPEVKTFEELVKYVLLVTQRERRIAKLSFGTANFVAGATEIVEKLSCGLFPKMLSMTRDQVERLRHDNIVSPEAIAQGRTLQGLGIEPQSIEAIVPTYLYRFRETGQYQGQRLE
jgi:NADH dehydrogenase